MAKNKQQKMKDRERRVAKAKLAATVKRRAEEKLNTGTKKTVSNTAKPMASSVKKAGQMPSVNKKTFTQRRSGS
ncbi:MAG: hypothetical protein JKY95_16300 [Planctomycetaceae bacterium]|nr:hypothetical protein [Planctomycetaceae bacterium]